MSDGLFATIRPWHPRLVGLDFWVNETRPDPEKLLDEELSIHAHAEHAKLLPNGEWLYRLSLYLEDFVLDDGDVCMEVRAQANGGAIMPDYEGIDQEGAENVLAAAAIGRLYEFIRAHVATLAAVSVDNERHDMPDIVAGEVPIIYED